VTTFVIKGVSGVTKDAATLRKGRTYELTGVQSGKDLTVADGASTLVIESGTGTAGQRWRLAQINGEGPANRRRHVFTSAADGRRLAVRDGAPVVEPDTDERDAAAQWILSTTGDGTYTLVNAGTGRLLEVGGQATHEGAAVGTWQPNSGSNQRWKVTDVTL
jgi:hypothetical protein